MFVELIATIFAGVACAGIAMLVNRISGGRLPRWLTPVVAGAGMIAMTIANEYTWFGRTTEGLPPEFRIAVTVEEEGWLRPWTMVWPYTKRFIAIDTAATRSNDALPAQLLTDLYFFGRWSPVNQAPVVFDCAAARSAVLIDGATFDESGAIADAQWQAMPADDPLLAAVCDR